MVCAVVLAGCGSTVVAGVAVPPKQTGPRAVAVPELAGLLLGPEQVATIMSRPVLIANPAVVGMLIPPPGSEFDPADCVSLSAPGQQSVYAGAGWTGVQTKGLRSPPGPIDSDEVLETVVAFSTARAAETFFANQIAQWSSCAGRTVTVTLPAAPGVAPVQRWTTAAVTRPEQALVVRTSLEGGHGLSCQRAVAVRSNVIIDVGVSRFDVADQAVAVLNGIAGRIRP